MTTPTTLHSFAPTFKGMWYAAMLLPRERSLIPDRIKTNGRTDDPMMGLAAMGLPACP